MTRRTLAAAAIAGALITAAPAPAAELEPPRSLAPALSDSLYPPAGVRLIRPGHRWQTGGRRRGPCPGGAWPAEAQGYRWTGAPLAPAQRDAELGDLGGLVWTPAGSRRRLEWDGDTFRNRLAVPVLAAYWCPTR